MGLGKMQNGERKGRSGLRQKIILGKEALSRGFKGRESRGGETKERL